jgi:hypothetical protein
VTRLSASNTKIREIQSFRVSIAYWRPVHRFANIHIVSGVTISHSNVHYFIFLFPEEKVIDGKIKILSNIGRLCPRLIPNDNQLPGPPSLFSLKKLPLK